MWTPQKRQEGNEPDYRSPQSASTSSSRDLLRYPNLRTIFSTGLFSMGRDMFTFFAPLQAVRTGRSPVDTAAIVATLSGGMGVIRFLVPQLTRRLGEWTVIAVRLLLSTCVFFAYPLLNWYPLLPLAAALLGMALGCGLPVSMSLLYRQAGCAGGHHEGGPSRGRESRALMSVAGTRQTVPLDGLARCSRTSLRFATCAAHVPDRHPPGVRVDAPMLKPPSFSVNSRWRIDKSA